ncbi:MAG: hypothetical protein IGS48_07715 [Oscillatoriales cyanobacterium C42_A2020_001]|nr:hypothetical protein [Leptolyngbyaceae cyanobacterium C42_A2020_001]
MITRQAIADVEQPDPHLLKQAEAAITDFETAIAPGVWTLLDKKTLIAEMRDRVRNPYKINQGGQPFCGPASVLFELVRKNPVRYVEICRNLYQLGGFHGATRFITSSEELRRATYGNLRMGQADWMILATLREMENILFPVEPNAPDVIRNLAGMTKSWEMRGWVQEIMGYKRVDYLYTFLNNDIQAITKASEILRQGGVAFALITADGMLNDKPPMIPMPTHWISLVGNISVQKDTVNLDIYTWSKKLHLQMDHGSFKKYLWAVVTGLP